MSLKLSGIVGMPKKFQQGGPALGEKAKPSFEDFLQIVNPEFRDTTNYDLRRAYAELPLGILLAWADNPDENHLPDTYKLPTHPTFSIESLYYKPGMKAGYWEGEKYIPIPQGANPPESVIMKKKIQNKQQGGLADIQNIDWSNYDQAILDIGNVLGTNLEGLTPGIGGNLTGIGGNSLGGGLANAYLNDDPNKFVDNVTGLIAKTGAFNSSEGYFESEKTKAVAQGKNNIDRKAIAAHFDKNKDEIIQKYIGTQTDTNNTDIMSGFTSASTLIDLLSNLSFSTGGNLMSKLGYADHSPFKTLKSIPIDGNIIDMSNTGVELLAIPDVGEPRQLKPYSGTHIFPAATRVVETPIFKKGGKKKRLNKYYQEGGVGAIGAQLEEGEVFATPDANIIDTAALEKHKNMLKDLITDILGGSDYVFSAMDKMKITRKEAEDISFGLGGVLYEEGEIADQPKEVLASDLFKEGEDEVQLAEYVKRIRDTYKITKKKDVFSKKANAGNKQSRGPFLAAAAFINEKKKGGGQAGYASTFHNLFNDGISTDANPIKNDVSHAAYEVEATGEPPKGQLGGFLNLLPFVGGVVQGIGALGSNRNNRKDIANLLTQDRKDIQAQAAGERTSAALASGINIAGYALQDPTVEAPQYDTTQLDSSIRRVPRSLFDFAAMRLTAASKPYLDQLFANSGSFSEAVNLYGNTAANNASAIATQGIAEVNKNIELENKYRLAKQGYADKQITADVTARNATRGNSNTLLAGAAGALSGGITAQGQITSNEQSALRNNNLQQTQNIVNWRNNKNNIWTNIISNAGAGITSATNAGLFNPNAPTPSQTQSIGSQAIGSAGNIQSIGSVGAGGVNFASPYPTDPSLGNLGVLLNPGSPGVPGFVFNPETGQYEWH